MRIHRNKNFCSTFGPMFRKYDNMSTNDKNALSLIIQIAANAVKHLTVSVFKVDRITDALVYN